MSFHLDAVQHVKRMRGGSQAHLLRASDGGFYVTKFSNNPQHIRVLANEMLGSRLGRWLDLPMPEVAVICVSDWLIQNTTELCFDTAGLRHKCSPGRHLGSRYPVDPLEDMVFDYLPESMFHKVRNVPDFARVLVLDKWTANSDGRQAIFAKKAKQRRYTAHFIDQGYCFNAGEWSFPDLALHGVYARNHVYAGVTGWNSFEPALTRAEEAEPIDIWRCADSVLPEWYGNTQDALEALVENLYERRLKIRDLITAFRESSRQPFPNWNVPRPKSSCPTSTLKSSLRSLPILSLPTHSQVQLET
jgi:hypothetical protein